MPSTIGEEPKISKQCGAGRYFRLRMWQLGRHANVLRDGGGRDRRDCVVCE